MVGELDQMKWVAFKELLISKGINAAQEQLIRGKHAPLYKEFLEQNLVCPKCKSHIEILMSQEEIRCMGCKAAYTFKDGIPCFVPREISINQQFEFNSLVRDLKRKELDRPTFRKEDINELIDPNTLNDQTRVVVIGGSFWDNLPYVRTQYKWNIDHIAHRFPELIFQEQELAQQGGFRHIAAKSELVPFPDGYADIVYSRNSLDHVDSPISTLLEISRILKPSGKFYLAVYYNSRFDDNHESWVINDEFIEKHLKNIFNLEHIKVLPIEASSMGGAICRDGRQLLSEFALPNRARLGWLNAVCTKKSKYTAYNEKDLAQQKKLVKNFEEALYYDRIWPTGSEQIRKAIDYYNIVLSCRAFDKTDNERQLYSQIRYLALTDPKAFRSYFKELAAESRDPWWWKLVIDSSYHFQRKLLLQVINNIFTRKEREHLISYIGNKPRYSPLRQFIRRSSVLYPIAKRLYHMYSKMFPLA